MTAIARLRSAGPRVGIARAALVLVAGLVAGCAPSGEESQFLARRAVLQRQNQGIRELIQEAEHGSLVPADRILIGVDEKVVVALLRSQLPFDLPLAQQFVVSVNSATVQLRDKFGRFQLEGEIYRPATPDRRTGLVVTGGLGAVRIEPGSGLLTMSIALDDLEVRDAGLLEQVLGPGGKKFVAEHARGLLQAALPPVRIPVAFTQDVHVAAVRDGPLQLDSLVVPLGLSVERVLAMEGKLWVTLHAGIGRQQGTAPGAGVDVKLGPTRSGSSSNSARRAPVKAATERSRGESSGGS